MNKKQLLELKSMAQKSKPYPNSEDIVQRKQNGDFFSKSLNLVPEIVDEILELRAKIKEYDNLQERIDNAINALNGNIEYTYIDKGHCSYCD